MNNCHKFYGKMSIVTPEVFCHLANKIHRYIWVMLELIFLQYRKLFGSLVLLHKRWITDNRPGSTIETGRKNSLHNTPTSMPVDQGVSQKSITTVDSHTVTCHL